MRHTNSGAKKKSENLDLASLSDRLGIRGVRAPLNPYYIMKGKKSHGNFNY